VTAFGSFSTALLLPYCVKLIHYYFTKENNRIFAFQDAFIFLIIKIPQVNFASQCSAENKTGPGRQRGERKDRQKSRQNGGCWSVSSQVGS
jgi:hypothetical protein